jgi:hypothetical protein
MPLQRRFSPCYEKGNNTAGKYLYPNARNVMATYYTNKDYTSLLRTPYNYRYSRATIISQILDTVDEPKPSTLLNSSTSS